MLVNSGSDPYGASREHAREGGADACAVAARTRLARIDPRGSALSSAILYLAIVGIWAVVLVPRWLRPRSAQPQPAEQQFTEQPAEPLAAPPADAQRDEEAEPAPDEAPAAAEAGEPVPASPSSGEPVPASPSPAARRADILQARRRMLGMIVAL